MLGLHRFTDSSLAVVTGALSLWWLFLCGAQAVYMGFSSGGTWAPQACPLRAQAQ